MKVLITLTLFLISFHSFTKSTSDFLPTTSCDQIIENKFYITCYSIEHRVAKFAAHWLSHETMGGSQPRTNDYRLDDRAKNPVNARDYSGSGFDRGHLVPAADMNINYLAMSESFFMTNMTPQRPGFNRGIWQSLERSIRKLVQLKGEAYIVSAPLLDRGLPQLRGEISIPESFYKIAYFPKTQEMVGYLIPNFSQTGHSISEFKVSIDELEALSGIDFFSQLPDEIESRLEAEL